MSNDMYEFMRMVAADEGLVAREDQERVRVLAALVEAEAAADQLVVAAVNGRCEVSNPYKKSAAQALADLRDIADRMESMGMHAEARGARGALGFMSEMAGHPDIGMDHEEVQG